MPRRLRSIDEIRLDVFQALRRAFIHRGFLPEKDRRIKGLKKGSSPTKSEAGHAEPTKKTLDIDALTFTSENEPQEAHEKLIDITERAQDILFKADTVFPFTLFPDTITLDREKLTVATRTFFRTARIISVPIDSISSAEVNVGPFFGSLHMASKYFVQNTYIVNFLTRSDAMKIEHLMQGFIIAHDKKVDLTDIDKDDLLVLLDDLGQGVSE